MKRIKKELCKLRLVLRGHILRYFRQLQNWQWLEQGQLQDLQQRRLEVLLVHAYQHVPFYREVLGDAGVITDSGLVRLDNFEAIPLLDKDTLRGRFADLKSDDFLKRQWYENTSGGSTGEPVRFMQDQESFEWRQAIKLLGDSWSGCSLCDERVQIWGAERDLFGGGIALKTRLGRWLLNVVKLNAFRMTSEQLVAFVEAINAFKPIQILAYAQSLYEISRVIIRENLSVYSPRSIMTSAETLHDYMRETIQLAFKAPVFNRYGSREVGDIACECEHHQGLHVSAPTHFVEILRPDGSRAGVGETGEIVITLLTNYTMPLIRYRIGDLGRWAAKPCSCGRAWPLLRDVVGRVSDVFYTENGTQIHGEYFTHLFYFKDWVKKFQVIQENRKSIRVLIVPNNRMKCSQRPAPEEIDLISSKIRLLMGEHCQVKYEFVDDIAPTDSGKYRYTISQVKSNENNQRISVI